MITFSDAGEAKHWSIGAKDASDIFRISNGVDLGSAADRLTIDAAGNVGIGVGAPTYQLQLSTDSAAKPGTSTWTIASDARLKDIHAPFERGLAALNGIKPIYFSYKSDNPLNLPHDKEYVGIIAQDAQKSIPEAVEKDDMGYLHVTNDSIIWTMLNAVKELYKKWQGDSEEIHQEILKIKIESAGTRGRLQAENELLRLKDAAQAKEIAELKARLQRIEKALIDK
jgi:hypothetical protein